MLAAAAREEFLAYQSLVASLSGTRPGQARQIGQLSNPGVPKTLTFDRASAPER
jgi:hypothetical protein